MEAFDKNDNEFFFQYVHDSISHVLNKNPEETSIIPCQSAQATIPPLICPDNACFDWEVFGNFIHKDGEVELCNGQHFMTLDTLVVIASKCEEAIFNPSFSINCLPSPLRGLLSMVVTDSTSTKTDIVDIETNILIATLLSLNMIESAIRDLVGKEHGRAPLLIDMIKLISDSRSKEHDMIEQSPLLLSSLLRSLLLPQGINLRNLLWHGFVSRIHRRWFALSLVLILSIDKISGISRKDEIILQDDKTLELLKIMRNQDQNLVNILEYGKSITCSQNHLENLTNELTESNFIPTTHAHLLTVLNRPSFLHKYPVVSAAVIGILIEMGLRLWWCDANQMHHQKIAQPGAYYVTLDGNSQRDKHDLILFPYTSNGSRNQLVYDLGGQLMAVLADLFSSHEGPNLRATIAHGLCNKYLYEELYSMAFNENRASIENLNDLVYANIFLLSAISGKKLKKMSGEQFSIRSHNILTSYRPVFSYTSSLVRGIQTSILSSHSLHTLIASEAKIKSAVDSLTGICQLTTILSLRNTNRIAMNNDLQHQILNTLSLDSTGIWSCEDTFQEVKSNQVAASCGASILLLNEVATGIQSYLDDVNKALLESTEDFVTSRRKKQIVRILSMANITHAFYNICILCALLHLRSKVSQPNNQPQPENQTLSAYQELSDTTILHAVKRSRMVSSTYKTATNNNRALNALSEFVKGKSVKMILQLEDI